MKSQLTVSFGGVVDREMKHLGKKASEIRDARAPRWRIVLAFLGWLAFGPSPILTLVLGRLTRGPSEQRIVWVFLGRLTFGPDPIRALVQSGLTRGTGLGLMIPT